jgi:hypothetical protein
MMCTNRKKKERVLIGFRRAIVRTIGTHGIKLAITFYDTRSSGRGARYTLSPAII